MSELMRWANKECPLSPGAIRSGVFEMADEIERLKAQLAAKEAVIGRLEAVCRECRDKLRDRTYSQTSFVYGSDTQKQKWAEWDIATEAAIAAAKGGRE